MQVLKTKFETMSIKELEELFCSADRFPDVVVLATNGSCLYRLFKLPEERGFCLVLVVDTAEVYGNSTRKLSGGFNYGNFGAAFEHVISDFGAEVHAFRSEPEAAKFIFDFIGDNS